MIDKKEKTAPNVSVAQIRSSQSKNVLTIL